MAAGVIRGCSAPGGLAYPWGLGAPRCPGGRAPCPHLVGPAVGCPSSPLRPRPGLSGGGWGLAARLWLWAHSLFSLHGFSRQPPAASPGLTVFWFLVSKRITWARRRQTGLISPGCSALTGSGTTGATQSPPPPRSEALPGTATTTTMSPEEGLWPHEGGPGRHASAKEHRHHGDHGRHSAATSARSTAAGCQTTRSGRGVAMRPGLTRSPAPAPAVQKKGQLCTPAPPNTHSHPVPSQHTITLLRARRAPDRPTLGPWHRSQS